MTGPDDHPELVYCRFWIKSNRGTNDTAHRLVDVYDSEDPGPDIRCELEEWCSQHGAWHHGENVVRYGYEIIGRNVVQKAEYALRQRLERSVGIGVPDFVDELVELAKERGALS